ncbi:MAG: helix-turn-helix transcriptional regulator [Acidimicrobiia bacterium]|nr:helix-turn-helix transcriptional regulator [Acidimicrobiia bacterium]
MRYRSKRHTAYAGRVNELEQRWADLGEFIREQRNIGQLSLRKLSEMAGISNPYLSQIERGLRRPSAEILQQIAKALHISAETLYVRAGILDEREEGLDVTAEIRRDPWLTEEQKKTLVHIYESFRTTNESLAASLEAAALEAESGGDAPIDDEPTTSDAAGNGAVPPDDAQPSGNNESTEASPLA